MMYALPKAPDGEPGAISAFGHDPAWALRIDRNTWRLSSADAGWDMSGETPAGERLPLGAWRYSNDAVAIDITAGICADSLTGERYFDSVRIEVDGNSYHGCGGPLLPPESLEGTSWKGKKQVPNSGDYIKRTFKGEVSFVDGEMTGTTGCNRFSAGYRVENGMLIAGPLMITKKLCEGQDGKFERQFMDLMDKPAQISFSRDGSITFMRRDSLYDYVFLSFDRVK